MREALLELLQSKKFLMALLGMLAGLLARFGWQMDPAETIMWLSPLMSAIVGQGIADHGKAAAQISADNWKPMPKVIADEPGQPVKPPESGRAVLDLLIALGVVLAVAMSIGVMSSGCSWLKGEAKKTGQAIIDCTKAESAKAVKELGPVVDVVLAQVVDSSGRVNFSQLSDLAKGWGTDIGGCVLADAVARALLPSPADPNAPKASPLEADRDALWVGFQAFKRQRFGEVTFYTSRGNL